MNLVEMRGVGKRFPGVVALDAVDFALRPGEIHALMGENGAGKSTLIKVLTGVYRQDAGEILLAGSTIQPRSPLEAQSLGISTVYQEVNLIPYLSVAENIYLGRQPTKLGSVAWRAMARGATEALRRLGLDIDVGKPLHSYSIAVQQLVAIARALDVQARVLVLDEPTSSLDAYEVARLFDVIRNLKTDGLGIVFVSHFLDQVYQIADRLTVLRNGRLVGEYEAASLAKIELVAKMLGKDVADVEEMGTNQRVEPARVGQHAIVAGRSLGRRGGVEGLDIELWRGEIVGLAGLLGSGRTEVAKMLFGVEPATAGVTWIRGVKRRIANPRKAIADRFGYCPEDRKTEALIPGLSVRENIALSLQSRNGWLRKLGKRKQRELAAHYVQALGIATPDTDKPVGQLSGGNQQKVVVARWLAAEPDLLILDEPTRGIDIGAKAEIEKLVASLAEQGVAILFVSSEIDEVVRDSHRVVVLRDRRKVGELSGEAITSQAIMEMIAGGVGA